MNVNIDFSILIEPSDAFGNVEGNMEFSSIPVAGDKISFMANTSEIKYPVLDGFYGELEVKQRIHISGEENTIVVQLDDVVLKSKEDAKVLSKYLESIYGLYVNEY